MHATWQMTIQKKETFILENQIKNNGQWQKNNAAQTFKSNQ